MHNCVLSTPGIQIHRQPIFHFGSIKRGIPGFGTGVPQEIPGGTHKSIHSISFPRAGPEHLGQVVLTNDWQYFRGDSPVGLNSASGRKQNRQILLRHRDYATFITINYRDGCPPIPLPGDKPITKAINNRPLAPSFFLLTKHRLPHILFAR